MAFFATPLEGFIIEFNEQTWSGQPLDIVFGNQQFFALFGITLSCLAFLGVDFFLDREGSRKSIAWFGTVVTAFTVLAGLAYTYIDPGALGSDGSLPVTGTGYVYALGLGMLALFLIVTSVVTSRGHPEPMAVPATIAVPMPAVTTESPDRKS